MLRLGPYLTGNYATTRTLFLTPPLKVTSIRDPKNKNLKAIPLWIQGIFHYVTCQE